mmetsp:Transcript_29289/g.64439  ORF Transcript_29289/g.64439 Transcript_29289/m.64439 type:complete len:256 (-) Transcript_29289:248-1015(-)
MAPMRRLTGLPALLLAGSAAAALVVLRDRVGGLEVAVPLPEPECVVGAGRDRRAARLAGGDVLLDRQSLVGHVDRLPRDLPLRALRGPDDCPELVELVEPHEPLGGHHRPARGHRVGGRGRGGRGARGRAADGLGRAAPGHLLLLPLVAGALHAGLAVEEPVAHGAAAAPVAAAPGLLVVGPVVLPGPLGVAVERTRRASAARARAAVGLLLLGPVHLPVRVVLEAVVHGPRIHLEVRDLEVRDLEGAGAAGGVA